MKGLEKIHVNLFHKQQIVSAYRFSIGSYRAF